MACFLCRFGAGPSSLRSSLRMDLGGEVVLDWLLVAPGAVAMVWLGFLREETGLEVVVG